MGTKKKTLYKTLIVVLEEKKSIKTFKLIRKQFFTFIKK